MEGKLIVFHSFNSSSSVGMCLYHSPYCMQKCYATIVENKLFLMAESNVSVKRLNKECAVKFSVL